MPSSGRMKVHVPSPALVRFDEVWTDGMDPGVKSFGSQGISNSFKSDFD